MHAKARLETTWSRLHWLIPVLAGIWVGSVVPLLNIVCLIAAFPLALYLAAKHRWLAAVLVLLLCPSGTAAWTAAIDYWNGTATLQYSGLPGPEFYNLDPELRCGRTTSGCLVDGSEDFTQIPNNAAVAMLVRLFGPQRGTYTGPYPTREQAFAALTVGTPVAPTDLASDVVPVAGVRINLATGVGQALFRGTKYQVLAVDPTLEASIVKEIGPITASLYQQQSLLLRIPGGEGSLQIALIDRSSGRPFAGYVQGEYASQFLWALLPVIRRSTGFPPALIVPVGLLVLLPVWLAVQTRVTLQRRLVEDRRRRGLCIQCGYDLRASPDRCPECGTKRGDNLVAQEA